jgi:ABC-type transport system substrate-binding protein
LVPHMRRIYRAEGASVKVIDDYTVEVNTGDAVAFDFTWRNRLNGANCPVPSASKKYFEEVGEERATMEGIGTGPWQFVEFRTNERFISEAVEDHWRKTPFFKELHYFQIPEESTRVANFLAGELDTMQMALGSIPALLDAPGVKFQRYPDALELHMNLHGQRYIDREGIPAHNPDFPWISASADPNSPEWEPARKVRETLSISINRQLIVDSVLEGEGRADNPYWRWGGLDRFFDEEMRNT